MIKFRHVNVSQSARGSRSQQPNISWNQARAHFNGPGGGARASQALPGSIYGIRHRIIKHIPDSYPCIAISQV